MSVPHPIVEEFRKAERARDAALEVAAEEYEAEVRKIIASYTAHVAQIGGVAVSLPPEPAADPNPFGPATTIEDRAREDAAHAHEQDEAEARPIVVAEEPKVAPTAATKAPTKKPAPPRSVVAPPAAGDLF